MRGFARGLRGRARPAVASRGSCTSPPWWCAAPSSLARVPLGRARLLRALHEACGALRGFPWHREVLTRVSQAFARPRLALHESRRAPSGLAQPSRVFSSLTWALHEPCRALHESPCTLARPSCILPPPSVPNKDVAPPSCARVYWGGTVFGGGWGRGGGWVLVQGVLVQSVLVQRSLQGIHVQEDAYSALSCKTRCSCKTSSCETPL